MKKVIKEEENFKPTFKKPMSVQSKNFEKNFKKTMDLHHVKLHEDVDGLLTEKEFSLKKKIFSLPKMEALVHSDPKLSAIYDEMAINGEEKYGYHYNETIMNMIFNDYVLNSAKYLQKYKMAIPIQKKRRDQSGINQLKKAGEKIMHHKTEIGTQKPQQQVQPKPVTPTVPQKQTSETTGAAAVTATAPVMPLGYEKKKVANVEESTTASSAAGDALKPDGSKAHSYVGYSGPSCWSKTGKPMMNKPIWKGGTVLPIKESNYLTESDGFEKYVNELNENIDLSYQTELGKQYKKTHTDSNLGLGVRELPRSPEIDNLKSAIDYNSELFVGQDVDRMRDNDVKILHNDMIEPNSMFPHPNNPNLQNDGISGTKPNSDNTVINKGTEFSDNYKYDEEGKLIHKIKETNLNLMEQPTRKITTPEELKAYVAEKKARGEKGLMKEDIPLLAGQALYNVAINTANRYLMSKGIPVSWNDLGDTNSMWDYIDENGGMEWEDFKNAVESAADDRLSAEGFEGFPMDESIDLSIGRDEKIKYICDFFGQPDTSGNYESKKEFLEKLDDTKLDNVYKHIKFKELSKKQTVNEKKASSVSKSQQRFMGMVHAMHKGELNPEDVGSDVEKAAQSMTQKKAEEFASTKHKGLPEKVKEGTLAVDSAGHTPMGFVIDYLKNKYGMSPEEEKEIYDSYEDSIIASPELGLHPSLWKLKQFAEEIHNSIERYKKNNVNENPMLARLAVPAAVGFGQEIGSRVADKVGLEELTNNNIKEDTQTMIQPTNTSMSNKSTPTGDVSNNGGVETGTKTTGRGIQESEEKLLEELNNELKAFSIHQEKLKKMTEDRRPSALVLKDRLGKENQANFKKDFQDSDTKEIIDVQKELEWKDQQTEVGDDPQKLGADIEKQVLKATKGEAFKNVGDSANYEGDEIPKRNLTKEEQHEVDLYRLGQEDLVYDNEPNEKFEKRRKLEMGEEIYNQGEEAKKLRATAPMYNKDTQPIETGAKDSVQFVKEKSGWADRFGLKESIVNGKYVDILGKKHLVNFKLNEVQELKELVADNDLFPLDFAGLGNTYTSKVNVNEDVKTALESYQFFTDEKTVFAYKPVQKLTESEQKEEKRPVNEQFEKMKHLTGYKPADFVKTNNVKKNRGF